MFNETTQVFEHYSKTLNLELKGCKVDKWKALLFYLVPFHHNINTIQCNMYRSRGLFPCSDLSDLIKCQENGYPFVSSAVTYQLKLSGFVLKEFYSVCVCLPFGGTNCSVLNKIFQFHRLSWASQSLREQRMREAGAA